MYCHKHLNKFKKGFISIDDGKYLRESDILA